APSRSGCAPRASPSTSAPRAATTSTPPAASSPPASPARRWFPPRRCRPRADLLREANAGRGDAVALGADARRAAHAGHAPAVAVVVPVLLQHRRPAAEAAAGDGDLVRRAGAVGEDVGGV